MLTGVSLNNGKTLKFGDGCFWYNPRCNGLNPVTTSVPTTLVPADYRTEITSKNVTIPSIIEYNIGRQWSNNEKYKEYVDSIEETFNTDCIWLWGNFRAGGAFFYKLQDTNYCGLGFMDFYKINVGFEQEPTYYYGIWFNTLTVPYTGTHPSLPFTDNVQIAFFKSWTRHEDVGDLVPPNGESYRMWYVMSAFPGQYEGKDELLPDSGVSPELLSWQQSEELYYKTWDAWTGDYLKNYTDIIDIQTNANSDHPWLRYVQTRFVPTQSMDIGMDETALGVIRITPKPLGGAGVDESGNPYGGTTSGEDGGDGTGSDYSDEIDDGGLPDSTITTTGICSIYLPTTSNMRDFTTYLFSGLTDSLANQIKKMFADPIQSVMSLALCHLNIPSTGTGEIAFAGIGSGVTAPTTDDIYHEVRYEIKLNEYWGSALDYSNYTKVKIYLPYCGIFDLSVDDFMNGSIEVIYKIDILSGMCIAMVRCDRRDKFGTRIHSVLYQFNGNVFMTVPLTSTNWASYFQSVLNMASVAVAPSASSAVGMAQDVMSQKVSVQKSGNIGSNFGYLGVQTPYLIIERPSQSIPVNFGSYFGYPSNIYGKVSTFKGYTEFDTDAYWTDNFGHATAEECDMIKEIMNGGVYL